MRKTKPLLLTVMLLASGNIFSTSAQSQDKRALIDQFRTLTGANQVTGSINFASDGIREILWAIVTEDMELTDAQKENLKKPVEEATVRVDKTIRDFLKDHELLARLTEETIFRIYDTTFTEAELKELINFYRTPTGQKAAAFLPGLSARVQSEFGPVIQKKIQEVMQPSLQAEIEQLRRQINDIKKDSN